MSRFIELFKERGDISFTGMRNAAVSLLPKELTIRNKLYNDLERGKGILDDDDHLNMYLYSYGRMHKAKLDTAFDSSPNIKQICTGKLEIYDWGCGQGVATICLLDYLKQLSVTPNISRICLVDPSKAAVERAIQVIKCYESSYRVQPVTKVFDTLDVDDFNKSDVKKIHLFSNILDVEAFDLPKFINLFQKLFVGENYMICVGPYYSNNIRVDEFVAAMAPDATYATLNLNSGDWKEDWTISLRIFYKYFKCVETESIIKKRIEEFHKEKQFFAGYILDAVEEEYIDTDIQEDAEILYNSLSSFDVKSNIPLDYNLQSDSKLAVLANIISRGLPTKAPILLEKKFSSIFKISEKLEDDSIIKYPSLHTITASSIFEALHIIDPRFKSDSYNDKMLESSFETDFIKSYLKGSYSEYLIQVLEPQRPLSSIVDIRDQHFSKDQRVDFALEIPYKDRQTGFILELDGKNYHSNIFQRLNDDRRDRLAQCVGWDTYRIEEVQDMSFIQNWESETSCTRYLQIIKNNYRKKISEEWRDTLQIVLSPLAIARVERMLVEAIMAGALKKTADEWNIVVVERDVPCAVLAIKDLQEKYENICALAGSNEHFPNINLTIVSTEEFKDSALHMGNQVSLEMPVAHYDLCIDISMLLRDNVDALPLHVEAGTYYLIRSSHYQKRERTICSAENIQYPHLVTKGSTGEYISIKEREVVLTYFLQDIFRKTSFRHGQLPILSRALSDKTTIGLLPTGGGKSLTYQLSCILQPGVAIIVDPLISLMIDQIRGLQNIRIDACDCVNSGMSGREKRQKLNRLQNGAVLFMLLSPERFMMENFRSSLMTMSLKNHIFFSYGVIDEVHCVSEWGHDFRTSYLHLGRNMINFMNTCSKRPLSIIGLTATASFDVLADVERELTLGGKLTIDSETIVRPDSDTRPELTYRIVEVNSDFNRIRDPQMHFLLNAESDWDLKDVVAEAKKKRMYSLLNEAPEDIYDINEKEDNVSKVAHIPNYNSSDFYTPISGYLYENAAIIFCPHAHGTFGVENNIWNTRIGISTELRIERPDISIGTFIGGDLPSGDMKKFNDNLQGIMVATKAFGMGIDKPNIRYTIHFNHPSSIEGYVQEAGRGGRDKKHAISYVLYEPTEYLHLTYDKINDIRYFMGKDDDPTWLENYINKYILATDIYDLCRFNHATEKQTKRLIEIIRKNGFLDNIDKNINLWFHKNSFRGLYKEKVMLLEMTDRLLNIKPTRITEIQGKLRETTGNQDVSLRVNIDRESITIFSHEERNRQYGYIFLDNLVPSYRYINFDRSLCEEICNTLIEILYSYESHTSVYLLHPLEGDSNIAEGIYSSLANADEDGNSYITVTWENQIQQNPEEFEDTIRREISAIAHKNHWEDLNEDRFQRHLDLSKIKDYDQLIATISECSGDRNWLRYHADDSLYLNLRKEFCRRRDKDDTDKAIYRMCCIGLVEDVTIDYLSQTYELKLHKHTDEEYKHNMLEFFRKYYSLEQAQKKVSEIDNQKGRNYLDKCLGYLTGFVYQSLKQKRYRAIEDICGACDDSINKRETSGNDNWLKEFIHLYLNSKYARAGYQVNGKDYSLMEDTDQLGKDGFDIVRKYINVIDPSIDNSGSEVDNVKHLYGATLLCLRAHPDNAALQLLRTFCITFLGTGNNETLKTGAYNSYVEGFVLMHNNDKSKTWEYIEEFNTYLKLKVRKEDSYIKENIIKNGKQIVSLFIHEKKLSEITNKYIN